MSSRNDSPIALASPLPIICNTTLEGGKLDVLYFAIDDCADGSWSSGVCQAKKSNFATLNMKALTGDRHKNYINSDI